MSEITIQLLRKNNNLIKLNNCQPYSKHLNHLNKKTVSTPPPPPHEPSRKFLSPPDKFLHPSPENIATLFKQSKKISAFLTQTQPLKENVIHL